MSAHSTAARLRDIAPGIALTAAAVLALLAANSSGYESYLLLLRFPLGPASLLLWVNDGLMAMFFLFVGLEIKRELLGGALSSRRQVLLPLVAAFGGMVLPALLYLGVNHADAPSLRGWAIPCATDIAFALGMLSLLGSRVPASLKLFLTAVAIIDDLGAILIIALFYSNALSLPMLGGALLCGAALLVLNLAGVRRVAPYVLAGTVLWYFVLKAGIHPTLAGVATALAIPLRGAPALSGPAPSVLEALERRLAPWVEFGVLPVFAFCNAGLNFRGTGIQALADPITLGIMLGLVVGKTAGVFTSSWLLIRLGWADGLAAAGMPHFFGIACLCGIGFTMSLFIGSLAFGDTGSQSNLVKMGVLGGSSISALAGLFILWLASRRALPMVGEGEIR